MHLRKLGERLVSLAAVGAVIATATVSLASPAAAVPAGWWMFKNVVTKKCLDVTSTGSAYQADCNPSNPYQYWDWAGTSADTSAQLRNQGSKRCLATNHVDELNPVWTTTCAKSSENAPAAMRWSRTDWTDDHILIKCESSGFLWTSPNKVSIYTNDNLFSDNADWLALPG